jgi:hypothetical protein
MSQGVCPPHGKAKPVACDYRVPSLSRDDGSRFVRDRIGIGKDFDFHGSVSNHDSPVTMGLPSSFARTVYALR